MKGLGEAAATDQGTDQNRGLLSVLFEVYENLRALKKTCHDCLVMEKAVGWLIGNLPGQERRPGLEEWAGLALKIDTHLKAIDGLVSRITLDPNALQEIYRGVLGIREIWISYGQWVGGYDLESDREEGGENVPGLMDEILTGLKKLLIGCATPGDTSYDMSQDTPSNAPSDIAEDD